jgi:hypothetical protein
MKMSKSLTSALVIGAVGVGLAAGFFVAAAHAGELAARTSKAAGVQVVVTPQPAGSGAAGWGFEVVMDTHSTPLDTDLARNAVLTDDSGRGYAPLAWQGDPPGGHHRKGILLFPVPEGKPKAVELKITGIGGESERLFQWELD